MDNDNKIAITSKEIHTFLEGGLLPAQDERNASYDLETEFRKTRKNRNIMVLSLLFATIALSFALTAGYTLYQSREAQNIRVSINAFEDVNLKQLLDSFQKTQSELDAAIAERENSKQLFETAMKKAGMTRDSAFFVVESMLLEEQEKRARKRTIESEYIDSTEKIQNEYEEKLAVIDAKIYSLQQNLKNMESPELERAQAEQGIMDSQKRVFEIERAKLVSTYTLQLEQQRMQMEEAQRQSYEQQRQNIEALSQKYQNQIDSLDPVFNDFQGNSLVAAAKILPPGPSLNTAASNLSPAEKQAIKETQTKIDNLSYLLGFFSRLPQKNSVTSYTEAMKRIILSMGEPVQNLVNSVSADRAESGKTIADLKKTIDDSMGAVTKTLENTQTELAGTNEKLKNAKDALEQVQAQYNEAQQKYVQTAAVVTELTQKNSALSGEVAASQAQAAEAAKKIAEAAEKVVVAQKEVTKMQTLFSALEAEVTVKRVYETYLASLCAAGSDLGLVLDVGDRKSFTIFVHPESLSRAQDRRVYIFSRESGSLLGSALIRKSANELRAYPESAAVSNNTVPNDRIRFSNTLR